MADDENNNGEGSNNLESAGSSSTLPISPLSHQRSVREAVAEDRWARAQGEEYGSY